MCTRLKRSQAGVRKTGSTPGPAASRRFFGDAQAVALAPDRLDRVGPERPVDLLTQIAHVHVHEVRARLVARVPDVLEQVRPGQEMAGAAQEGLEQGELPRREHELAPAPPGPPGLRVEPEVADGEDVVLGPAPRPPVQG